MRPNHRKTWLIAHDTDLRMWWVINLPVYKIAERLGRTPKGVSWRAKKINLRPRRKSPTLASIPLVGNVFEDAREVR